MNELLKIILSMALTSLVLIPFVAQNVENINQLNMLAEISESLKIKKPVELLVNPLISSPIFIGLKKQVIILPDKSYSEKELKFIFRH